MASPITLLTKVHSGRLGEIVTFKCDNVFEAIYAVKNNTKMYKNPILKKRSSSPSKDDDKKKGKEKRADDDKMDDSVINYYKVKMQCSNLPNPKALKSDKHEHARSYLKRARVTIVDEDDVEAMDEPIPTGKGHKHVLYKDGNWYAVLKTDSDQDRPMTNKEMQQLEKDFAEHAALQEKRRSKRVPGDANDELLAFVSSFVGQSADNLSRVQRYEKAVIKRFEDDLRALEEELKAEYKKHHHKDKRMTKDETIFNSDKFKIWYGGALKERMTERMSEQKGGAKTNRQEQIKFLIKQEYNKHNKHKLKIDNYLGINNIMQLNDRLNNSDENTIKTLHRIIVPPRFMKTVEGITKTRPYLRDQLKIVKEKRAMNEYIFRDYKTATHKLDPSYTFIEFFFENLFERTFNHDNHKDIQDKMREIDREIEHLYYDNYIPPHIPNDDKTSLPIETVVYDNSETPDDTYDVGHPEIRRGGASPEDQKKLRFKIYNDFFHDFSTSRNPYKVDNRQFQNNAIFRTEEHVDEDQYMCKVIEEMDPMLYPQFQIGFKTDNSKHKEQMREYRVHKMNSIQLYLIEDTGINQQFKADTELIPSNTMTNIMDPITRIAETDGTTTKLDNMIYDKLKDKDGNVFSPVNVEYGARVNEIITDFFQSMNSATTWNVESITVPLDYNKDGIDDFPHFKITIKFAREADPTPFNIYGGMFTVMRINELIKHVNSKNQKWNPPIPEYNKRDQKLWRAIKAFYKHIYDKLKVSSQTDLLNRTILFMQMMKALGDHAQVNEFALLSKTYNNQNLFFGSIDRIIIAEAFRAQVPAIFEFHALGTKFPQGMQISAEFANNHNKTLVFNPYDMDPVLDITGILKQSGVLKADAPSLTYNKETSTFEPLFASVNLGEYLVQDNFKQFNTGIIQDFNDSVKTQLGIQMGGRPKNQFKQVNKANQFIKAAQKSVTRSQTAARLQAALAEAASRAEASQAKATQVQHPGFDPNISRGPRSGLPRPESSTASTPSPRDESMSGPDGPEDEDEPMQNTDLNNIVAAFVRRMVLFNTAKKIIVQKIENPNQVIGDKKEILSKYKALVRKITSDKTGLIDRQLVQYAASARGLDDRRKQYLAQSVIPKIMKSIRDLWRLVQNAKYEFNTENIDAAKRIFQSDTITNDPFFAQFKEAIKSFLETVDSSKLQAFNAKVVEQANLLNIESELNAMQRAYDS